MGGAVKIIENINTGGHDSIQRSIEAIKNRLSMMENGGGSVLISVDAGTAYIRIVERGGTAA